MKTVREQTLAGGLARLVDMGGAFAAVLLEGGKVVAQMVHANPDTAWQAVLSGKGAVAGRKPMPRGDQVEALADGPYGPVAELVERGSGAIYLTGRAGSGKTTFLKGFLDATNMKAAVVAPSGI
nr:hypothetical protein [Hyphomonadaceae bacterium]